MKLQPHCAATPLFSMKTVSLVSRQSCGSIDSDAWSKQALTYLYNLSPFGNQADGLVTVDPVACITGLQRLVSYDPVKDKEKIMQTKLMLESDFQKAQDEITELVQEKRRNFDRRVSVLLAAF